MMTRMCCFTGHRPEKLAVGEREIRQALAKEIAQAVADGYRGFITGMARGVDLWAAGEVLALRGERAELRLICALPYDGFERRWSRAWQDVYRRVLAEADRVAVCSDGFSYEAFQVRNRWMVDRSSRLIAVYNGAAGGTANTVAYARRQGCDIRFVPG